MGVTGTTAGGPRIAVVGVTGVVGRAVLELFDRGLTPVGDLVPLASARSAGQEVACLGRTWAIGEATEGAFDGVDVAYFCADGDTSHRLAPAAAKAGAIVIDNSSAFRMDPDVPLVIPEVNGLTHLAPLLRDPRALAGAGRPGAPPWPGIIANPNCSTIIMLMAITPIHRAFGVRRIVVSTYQAVSGAGQRGLDAFEAELDAASRGEPPAATGFPEPCFANVFLHESPMNPITGRTQEEQKMLDETRKIWGQPYGGDRADDPAHGPFGPPVRTMDEPVRIAATCVRVGVRRAHSESIALELEAPATVEGVRQLLLGASGVRLVDDRAGQRFPTPLAAEGRDEVLVGRIRLDDSLGHDEDGDPRPGLELFCSGDQILKGAALNAVQIGELVRTCR